MTGFKYCTKSAVKNCSCHQATAICRPSALLFSPRGQKTVKRETAGLQTALRTDAVTMNNSILEGSCSSDSLQNTPFSSLSSAFPYLSPHLTCSTRLTFYLTATALVCVGVDGDEVGFSSKK